VGLYTELFYAIIPTLFLYLALFAELLSLHLVTVFYSCMNSIYNDADMSGGDIAQTIYILLALMLATCDTLSCFGVVSPSSTSNHQRQSTCFIVIISLGVRTCYIDTMTS